MKRFRIVLIAFFALPIVCFSQINIKDTVLFDDFEYTTNSPHLIDANIYTGTNPKTFDPYSEQRHLYFNFIDDLAAGTVCYDREMSLCAAGGQYDLSFWTRESNGNGQYSVTIKIYEGSALYSIDTIEDIAPNNYKKFNKRIDTDSSTIRMELLNTWKNTGVGNYDVAFDALLLEVYNRFDSTKTNDNGILFCYSNQNIDLHPYITGGASANGTWDGPSQLSNGYLGTYSPLSDDTGTYNYQILSPTLLCEDTSIFISVELSSILELGNDTVLCIGDKISVDAGNFSSYNWNTGDTTSSISITNEGMYKVETKYVSSNIVTNPDFQTGNVGFTTQYIIGTGGTWGPLSNPGTYGINTDASNLHNNFVGTDHTSGTGNFLIVNGSSTANTEVWCQNININPNLDYEFSSWVSSVENGNPAILQFSINGVLLGAPLTAPTSVNIWDQFFSSWTSGPTDTSARICIVNQNTTGGGNDFGIDDISFSTTCFSEDSIYVNYDTISYNPIDTFLCKGESKDIILDNSLGYTYTWLIDNTISTIYKVDSIGEYKFVASNTVCSDTFSFNVELDNPYVDFTTDIDSGYFPLDIQFTNLGVDSISYLWEFGNGDTSIVFNPNYTYNDEGEYITTLIGESVLGCKDTAIYSVVVFKECELIIPTVFTPDDDGQNDTWHISGLDCFENIEIKVFNRWGTLVHENDNDWSSDNLPVGSYYYVITYTDLVSNESISTKGTVTIVR